MSHTLPVMKPELAELLAATDGDEVRVVHARRIITTFTEKLAMCSMCDGTGEFTFAHDVDLALRDALHKPLAGREFTLVKAGTEGDCPRCGGTRFDPEFVAWRCFSELIEIRCREAQRKTGPDRKPHAHCGYRVMLPFDDEAPAELSTED